LKLFWIKDLAETMMDIELHPNERVDDLLTQQLKIIQSEEAFSFSMDAVLLARFCSVPMKGRILDLCTGNAVIPLLLSTRTGAKITGVEIQGRLAEMARRNVVMNSLQEQIEIIHDDLRRVHLKLGYGKFDAVTVNPPYMPANSGDQNSNPYVAIARHEIYCTLEDVVSSCSKLVRTGGKVAMVHRPSRLVDMISMMRRYKLEPKRIRFVHPRLREEANMVLVEAIRDGKAEVRLLPPLIVYEEDGEYCEELMEIYYGTKNRL
jgi:tRNA1(Val) A37 N6-methylase TrmN6